MANIIDLIVDEGGIDRRVDVYLTEVLKIKFPEMYSRNQIVQSITDGYCILNGSILKKPSHKLRLGDHLKIEVAIQSSDLIPDPTVQFEIIYEDECLLVISKPQGLIVHPASGTKESTLVHGLYHHLGVATASSTELSDWSEPERIGIVHRLDKETSGLMVVAKTMKAKRDLQNQLKSPKTMKRIYHALTSGEFKICRGVTPIYTSQSLVSEITVEAPIARDKKIRTRYCVSFDKKSLARDAKTTFRIISSNNGFNLLECELDTGRTHQIRVHLEYLNNYIIGDKTYNRAINAKKQSIFNVELRGQMLHARALSFIHPETKKVLEFQAPYNKDFKATKDRLGL